MSFFGSRRTRYTAAVMLFVWLMSLGISVANACLVQQDHPGRELLSHSRSGMTSVAATERDVALHNFAKAHVQADENVMSPEKLTCLNFCVAEQDTLVKHQVDSDLGHAIVPVLFLTWPLLPALDQISQPEAFGSLTSTGPPIFIRYLRLTI